MWPHYESVAKKCAKVHQEAKEGKDISRYQTTGAEDRRSEMPKKSFKGTQSPGRTQDPSMTISSNKPALQNQAQPKFERKHLKLTFK